MIGRGAIVTPGIFRAIACRLAGKPQTHPVMLWTEKRDFLLQFVKDINAELGTAVMLRRVKLLARWMCEGLENGLLLYGNLCKAAHCRRYYCSY